MTTPETTQPELLLSVARVARLMRVPKEFVRLEIRRNRLRVEAVLIGDRLGIACAVERRFLSGGCESRPATDAPAGSSQGGSWR